MTAPSIERPTLPRRLDDPTPVTIEPLLARLAAELPTLSSALVCSSDGRALAAYGLTPEEATRLSVLASSLHAVSTATTRANHDRPLDHVTLASGAAHTVVVSVPSQAADHPLLVVTADDVSLGRMLLQTRRTADGVRAALERYAGRPVG